MKSVGSPMLSTTPLHIGRRLLRRLADLSVGHKLLLIYLLDLTTVIFISGVLIREKYIAIDFARKELSGIEYISAVRPTLIALARRAAPYAPAAAEIDRLEAGEREHGAGMRSDELNRQLVYLLQQRLQDSATEANREVAFERAGALVTRVGNQSNLILDPDLDSYYTMSLIVLRYPALLDVMAQTSPRLRLASGKAPVDPADRTRLFVLEGELEAANKAIASDHSEAVAAAADGVLRERLSPAQAKLALAIGRFRAVARDVASGNDVGLGAVNAAEAEVIGALDEAWSIGAQQLTRLIDIRIHDFFVRMAIHLGTAALLLMVILLTVYYVAQRISRPLRRLSAVVETVRRTGDHSLRASWQSGDEIGRLVDGFNEMLAQLDQHRHAQQELVASARAAEAQQRLLELMPVPLMVTSVPDHQVLHANPPARAWLGNVSFNPWAKGLDGASRRRFFQELADRGVVDEFEVRWQGNGKQAWAVLSAVRLDYQGQDSIVTAFMPINRMKALEQRLELWAKAFEASSEGMLLLDASGNVLTANRAFCRAGALDPAELVGKALEGVLIDDVPSQRVEAFWAAADARGWWRGEVAVRRRDRSTYPAWAVLTAVRDAAGQLTHYIFSCLDISERKASEERVEYLAHHDVLTGLPNRTVAEERLQNATRRARATGEKAAVLFIDLDRFKNINDSLGHQTGDSLLKLVAARLHATVRDVDTVSRFGGDEFVVLLNGVTDSDEALHITQRLVEVLRMPYSIEDIELNISCSIGVAMFPDDAHDMDELMRHADAAMYQAKAAGRDNIHFFTDALNERAQRRLQIELLLRNAVARDEFRLVYQPQVNAIDGLPTAVEALLRWSPPELGEVSPTEFIPIAEESRLILPIGEWVIDEACRQMAQWRAAGIDPGLISVNLSAVQLLDSQLLPSLQRSLQRHGLEPAALELELTESTLMDSTAERLHQLHALRDLGVQLSIDDFGTGYSSLSYLSRLPMNKLKIDRSLVTDMLKEPKDRAITEAMIALAHRLKMTVVAEGVETAAVRATLADACCDGLQGWHIARPMAPDALGAWLRANGPRRLTSPASTTLLAARAEGIR